MKVLFLFALLHCLVPKTSGKCVPARVGAAFGPERGTGEAGGGGAGTQARASVQGCSVSACCRGAGDPLGLSSGLFSSPPWIIRVLVKAKGCLCSGTNGKRSCSVRSP